MSFHEESQLSDVRVTICLYLYITNAEVLFAGVQEHSFSSSAGLQLVLLPKCTLGKNHWVIACAFVMMTNTLMIRFGSIALRAVQVGKLLVLKCLGRCEAANFAKFATLRRRMRGCGCFFRGLAPRKGC